MKPHLVVLEAKASALSQVHVCKTPSHVMLGSRVV